MRRTACLSNLISMSSESLYGPREGGLNHLNAMVREDYQEIVAGPQMSRISVDPSSQWRHLSERLQQCLILHLSWSPFMASVMTFYTGGSQTDE